jgi:hypothetical protein
MDTGRQRTFQVIEFTDFADLLVDNSSVAADTAPASYANMIGMSGSPNIDSTDSIPLVLANYVQDSSGGSDEVTESRLSIGAGGFEGAEISNFTDSVDRSSSCMLARAVDNESGVTAMSMQWQIGKETPTADTGRERTFQVIDLVFPPPGAISASPDLAITAAADLRALGALSASPAMAFALGADLNGIGQLSASAAMAFALGANLSDKQFISASPMMAFTLAAKLRNATPQTENRSRHIERFIN